MKPIILSNFYSVCKKYNFHPIEIKPIGDDAQYVIFGWTIEDSTDRIIYQVRTYYSDMSLFANESEADRNLPPLKQQETTKIYFDNL